MKESLSFLFSYLHSFPVQCYSQLPFRVFYLDRSFPPCCLLIQQKGAFSRNWDGVYHLSLTQEGIALWVANRGGPEVNMFPRMRSQTEFLSSPEGSVSSISHFIKLSSLCIFCFIHIPALRLSTNYFNVLIFYSVYKYSVYSWVFLL